MRTTGEPSLQVLAALPGATIQDGGRFGHQRHGVTPAGPMDWAAFQTANLALGNKPGAAALEIGAGIELACLNAPLPLAFCGGAYEWRRDGHSLPSSARLVLQPGETLSCRPGPQASREFWGAWTYCAVAGGFATPPVMGSRATHTRSHLGGIDGRMLQKGDQLPAASNDAAILAVTREEGEIDATWLTPHRSPAPINLRVIPGPQDDYFSREMIERFYAGPFRLTPVMDRMAYRLEGPKIVHAKGYNIVSDGIAEGAIQIAGDQQPLVLMADHQPTGGYPKIAHVIRADLGHLAQARPGASLRFTSVTLTEAREALFALEAAILTTPRSIRPFYRPPTTESLSRVNLVDGVIDALS